MRAQERVGLHKKYHGGNRNFSKIALYTRSLVYVSVPAETSHDLGASPSGLGPPHPGPRHWLRQLPGRPPPEQQKAPFGI